jgi:hypothetical protein
VVERRIEHRDVRHGGKGLPHFADAGDVQRIVQGGERIERLDLCEHLVGDERSFGELLAAVNHAMRHDTLGLEERNGNEQDLAPRLGNEVRRQRIAGHHRHLAKRIAGVQLTERVPGGGIPENGGVERAAQDDSEVRGFVALVGDGFVGFEQNHARAGGEVTEAFVGEIRENSYVLFEKFCGIHVMLWLGEIRGLASGVDLPHVPIARLPAADKLQVEFG